MARWGEIKCPRCEGLKDRLNYAVGEREDYEKIIKQLQAEWLANRVAIMRLEAKLAKAVVALELQAEVWSNALELNIITVRHRREVSLLMEKARATLAELTGGKDA